MNISFIGHGYVGLVTAAVFADLGNTVWIVGRTNEKIENLKQGIMPFYEPGLEETVRRNLSAKRMRFTVNYQEAVSSSEVIFIAVGTPPKKNGEADLTSVFIAANEIGKNLEKYAVVVTKSTVPPGTNKRVNELINKVKSDHVKFDIASCPEFLREGTALQDTLQPDRVVIGTESEKAKKILIDLHKPINGKYVVCNVETAEMIKYASNSLLSTKISFANAIALLCEKVGADAEVVLEGVGLDKRLGRAFLYPGVGYGGSCFPKDVKALIALADKLGYNFTLLKAVDEINVQASRNFVGKIKRTLKPLQGKTVAILGLAFKPNTDDMREAPALIIIQALQKEGVNIKVYDPIAMANANKLLQDVTFCKNAYDAASGSHGLVIVTEWNEFRQLDLNKIMSLLKSPNIFDGRNIYDPVILKQMGFNYYGVGRKN